MRAPKAETGLLKPSNVKGLTDLLQIQAITGIGFSSLPASSSTCPIGLLSVFSRIKQSHSTASVYVGLDMGKQKKHLEGRLFTGFLAGQKKCQHKLSSPQEGDSICTSYQPQRFQFSRAGFPALTPSTTRLLLALWAPRPGQA